MRTQSGRLGEERRCEGREEKQTTRGAESLVRKAQGDRLDEGRIPAASSQGAHLSLAGRAKTRKLLLGELMTSRTACGWLHSKAARSSKQKKTCSAAEESKVKGKIDALKALFSGVSSRTIRAIVANHDQEIKHPMQRYLLMSLGSPFFLTLRP